MTWTPEGIVQVLGALGVFFGVIVTLWLKVMSDLRQMKALGIKTHDLVNSLSERKDAAIADAANLKGKSEGEAIAKTAMELAKAVLPQQAAAHVENGVRIVSTPRPQGLAIADPKIISTKGKKEPKK